MRKFLIIIWLLFSFTAGAQNILPFATPVPRAYSAFNDIAGWWRADTFTGSSGSYSLTDLSANAHPMVQQAGTMTTGTGVNSRAKITGNASAYFNSGLSIKNWPITVITVALRANNATCGFFGHTGATPANTLWYGYEASNINYTYLFNGSTNTTSEAGTIAVYMARIGQVSNVSFVNGIIQPTMTGSSRVRSGANSTSIGTQYRGLNIDWYETLVWDRVLTIDDIDEVNAYINTRYGISIPLWSSYTALPTAILGGQSNKAGRALRGASDVNIPSPYNGVLTGCNVWFGTPSGTSIGTAFSTLSVAANNHMLGEEGGTNPSNYFGSELTFAKDYITAHGGSVYLMKFAIGGSSLAQNAILNYWSISDESEAPGTTSRKKSYNLMTNWWQMMRVMQSTSNKPNLLGVDWYQGEQDGTNLTDANNYQTNLTNFISDFRNEIGYNRFQCKFFITRIHSGEDPVDQPYLSTIRTAQQNVVSSVPNCQLVDVDSYTLKSDQIHLNHTAQLALGSYLATLF